LQKISDSVPNDYTYAAPCMNADSSALYIVGSEAARDTSAASATAALSSSHSVLPVRPSATSTTLRSPMYPGFYIRSMHCELESGTALLTVNGRCSLETARVCTLRASCSPG
jgi:hypothetical protein